MNIFLRHHVVPVSVSYFFLALYCYYVLFFFQAAIPNFSQLTSEIAIVVVDGKEIFVDPGTPLCPFGQLAWQHTSSQGMRQTSDGGTALAPTPSANYKDAISKRVGRLVLSEDG